MKRISKFLGAAALAGVIGIIGLLFNGIQMGQANKQAKDDEIANATMMAIENEQSQRLAAGATMVALQEKQLQGLEHNATIIALQQQQLIAIEEIATLQADNPKDSENATRSAERLVALEATNEALAAERDALAAATPLPPPAPKNCSIHSWIPTEITFINRGDETVFIYWINGKCEEVYYQTLEPGYQYTQQTFVTHPWVIRNDDNRLINSYTAIDSERMIVTIP